MTITRFSGKVYPDKSFTLGLIPKEKKGTAEAQYERDREHYSSPSPFDGLPFLLGTASIQGAFCSLSENPCKTTYGLSPIKGKDDYVELLRGIDKVDNGDYSDFYNCDANLSSPLFIVSPKSSRAKRGSYGKHGITGFGRRVVKNACILLEQRYGRKRLGFITCTLPSFSEQIQRAINKYWGEITRRFYQKLKRKSEARGRKFIYVGVTEIQEKRFKKYGVPCPHLHFVYLSRDYPCGEYLLKPFDYWAAWNKSIVEVLNLYVPHLCMDAILPTGSCHGKYVQKSAAAYLGKYISKGSSVLADMLDDGWEEFPKQWWTASKLAKKFFKDALILLKNKRCQDLFFSLEKYLFDKSVTHVCFIYIESGGREYCTGLSGTFSDSMYRIIKETG